ncbi:MAG: SDR family NAD(P)-dependent oxidoreductase [Rickettsiales bacterium]|jgi:NADP-dependent 3-hydroxy acid dehydrogenase YdfG|nr:SDR family NAD(P)-dependent oxidoreductase [Rickettsiales bacterium]
MKKFRIPNDSVIFITGTSTGFGRAIALAAIKHGYNVVATARRIESLNYLSEYKNVLCVAMDVTDEKSIKLAIKAAVKKFGKIDILVNNAGINYVADIMDFDNDKMRALFETNVFGIINMTRDVLPYMPNEIHSAIINVSSIDGLDAFYEGQVLYGISKNAVNGMTQALRNKKNNKIRSMSINPGKFPTNIRLNSLENMDKNDTEKEQITEQYLQKKGFGDIEIAANDIIETIAAQSELPMYMVLGVNAVRRFKRINNKMRYDYRFVKKLKTNQRTENLLSRILRKLWNKK